jgi:DNA (cytosine-5)-methyltransferase 1
MYNSMRGQPTFLEFFAGGGLARVGLDGLFASTFANDIDAMKCAAWRANFSDHPIIEGDIWNIEPDDVPNADLAWASFPCQDLSLAGARRGLNAPRSGAFWGFWKIIEEMGDRAPRTLALENVPGLLSSRRGRDFSDLISHLADAGYRVGAMMIDAALFSPQSRPRLFIVAHKGKLPAHLVADEPDAIFHPPILRAAVQAMPLQTQMAWAWWSLPHPPQRNTQLLSLLDRDPPEDAWRSDEATEKLLDQMAPLHRQRVDAALKDKSWNAGAVYRRIRLEDGEKIQRAEIRYDGLAGCLRTPAGGSSKQLLLVTHNGRARLRPLLAREAARLMGCADDYKLPANETAALKVLGDAVCVPAVRWLGKHLLAPLSGKRAVEAAA